MAEPTPDWAAFERRYARMSDDELVALAEQQDQLTPAARGALLQELSRRSLDPHDLSQPESEDASDQFVRFHQHTELSELLFLVKALASLGIEARIEDQERHTLEWYLEHEMDGIGLFVRLGDVDAARDVLRGGLSSSEEEEN